MEKNMKIIIGIVAAIVVLLLAGLLLFSNSEITIEGNDAQIKLPSNYTMGDNLVANAGDVNVSFIQIQGSTVDMLKEYYGAIKANGKDSGYENITNRTVNGFTIYEFAAHPDKLKNVSTEKTVSGDTEQWTEYPPEAAGTFNTPVDHFRSITYEKDGKINQLLIYTNNSSVNLYNSEIEGIINSIAPLGS